MPRHVVNRVADALNAQQKPISGSKILILGVAYKPNVDDDRESPSYVLMNLLSDRGAQLEYYDPSAEGRQDARPLSRATRLRAAAGGSVARAKFRFPPPTTRALTTATGAMPKPQKHHCLGLEQFRIENMQPFLIDRGAKFFTSPSQGLAKEIVNHRALT